MSQPATAISATRAPGRGPADRTRIAPRPFDDVRTSTLALTYGTFDLFHVGHVRLFERIKQRFDRLVVAVSTDEFNALKGKRAVMPYADRAELVAACRFVDEVMPEGSWEQKARDVVRLGANAVVMGDDWAGHFDELARLCEVIYLPRTQGVSSSLLKDQVQVGPRPCDARP